jgi:nitrate reductase NapA
MPETVHLTQNRRDAMKLAAATAAASVAGISLSPEAGAQAGTDGIRWDKGVCRFCGTGCGVIVGTKNGQGCRDAGRP